jgi:hypothetical protein
MVQGLLTPAFRPGIEGRENQWGFSPKHKKGYDFLKKMDLKGNVEVAQCTMNLNPPKTR